MAAEDRTRELLERAEEVGGVGSFDWSPEEGELLWSDNLYRIYGFEPGSVTPSIELFLEHCHPGDRAKVAASVERQSVHGMRWRWVRPDGSVRHLEATIAESGPRGTPGRRLLGQVRDLTEQRHAEREIAMHVAVAEALERWPSAEDGLVLLLAEFGAAVDAICASLWVPEADGLSCRARWFDPHRKEEAERRYDRVRRLGPRAAERAWRTGLPTVSRSAPGAGPGTTVAVPARHGDEALAVLEMHTDEVVEAHERLLRSLTGVGYEIGHFLHRRRGEVLSGPLTRRETEVLQHAADGLSPREIAERLSISPATVKRHFEGIYQRLEVPDRAAAVAEGMRRGLVD